MPFDNDTNRKRVAKIVETLALIETSAAANRATTEDMREMLAPILGRIDALAQVEAPAVTTRPGQVTYDSPPGSLRSRIEGLHATDLADLMSMIAHDLGEMIRDNMREG